MIDLKINNTGDLILDRNTKYPSFCISFYQSTYPGFTIDFVYNKNKNTLPTKLAEAILPTFELSFETTNAVEEVKTNSVFQEDELRQRILIALRTEYGDLKNNETFGSLLHTMYHERITDETVLTNIENIVYDTVSTLIKNPTVIIERKQADHFFFCQNVLISIYDNDVLIYSFEYTLGG